MGWTSHRYRRGCISLLLAGILGSAQADEPAQRYGCVKPIRLALLSNAIVYRDGKGFDPDMIAELQRRTGCTFEARLMPRAVTWDGLADGSLDMVTNGVPNDQRRQQAFFIPTLFYRNKLIVPAALAPQIARFSDFQKIPGAQFGTVRGYWNGPYFEGTVRMLYSQGRVREYPNDSARFAALRSGEVSALIAHDINLNQMLPADEQLNYRVLDLNPGPSLAVGLLLSRRTFTAPQASEWLRLLETMRLDGSLAALVRTHMPAHLVEEFLRSGYRYEVSKRSGTQ